MARPRIGVPAQPLVEGRVRHWTSRAFGVPATYIECLRRAGALPVVLTCPDDDAEEGLALLDGLLLIGGGDVEPSRYVAGRQGHPELYGIEPDRDDFELALLRAADARALPTLCVCRGMQVMNVAFGGTLIQHLPDDERFMPHSVPSGDERLAHDVKLVTGNRIADAANADVLSCASHHHQGVGTEGLGEGLVATGWSEDGLVEAIERENGWIVGAQWHPEETAAADPGQQGLFDALVRRAGG